MRSSNSSPRRCFSPKNTNKKLSPPKLSEKQSITHLEFLSAIEPFLETIKEKNFEELKKPVVPKAFTLKREIYHKFNEQLKDRLCGLFIFDENVEIEKIETDTEFTLKKPIKTQKFINSIFEKHEVLKHYYTLAFKQLQNEYETQVAINNKRRVMILKLIEERMDYQSYTYAFDLIQHEMTELYKRIKSRKKRSNNDTDELLLHECNARMSEFYKLFGTFDQFTNDCLIYENCLASNSDDYEAIGLKYFD